MIKKFKNYLIEIKNLSRANQALIKGHIMMQNRTIDPKIPYTWEFSGFSQNGEDGIIHFLRSKLNHRNHYFLEIGASDGIENNTSWLLIAEKYNGVFVEGNKNLAERINRTILHHHIGAKCLNVFVTIQTVEKIYKELLYKNPDVFSLDIDGNDYFIAEKLLSLGFRPKIIVVEYNSAYGPERKISINYNKYFNFLQHHSSLLYYGVSISAWKSLFDKHNYSFVTVESCGVNAFFIDKNEFNKDFINEINGVHFQENQYQLKKFGITHEKQFALVEKEFFCEL
ncbi:MAG: hypothetical protein K1X29_00435 [Bdellovibrionales bacterium]|nr:hypothetical protein [Bdellovibrionales bacterium]